LIIVFPCRGYTGLPRQPRNEAWIIADEIRAERGGVIELEDAELQESVVARLHRLCGRFVNRAMRFAVRLDEDERDDNGEFRRNLVSARLVGPEQYEPQIGGGPVWANASVRNQPSVFDGVTSIPPDFRTHRGRWLRRRRAPIRFRRICIDMRPAQHDFFLRYGRVFR